MIDPRNPNIEIINDMVFIRGNIFPREYFKEIKMTKYITGELFPFAKKGETIKVEMSVTKGVLFTNGELYLEHKEDLDKMVKDGLLIELKPMEFWINVYNSEVFPTGKLHKTKEEALANIYGDHICTKHFIEAEE